MKGQYVSTPHLDETLRAYLLLDRLEEAMIEVIGKLPDIGSSLCITHGIKNHLIRLATNFEELEATLEGEAVRSIWERSPYLSPYLQTHIKVE